MPGTEGRAGVERRYRVIVADDDEGIRQQLVQLLSEKYDLVGLAASGRELVAAALRLQPDLVIVDVSMPGMNGFEAVKQMKADGVTAKVIFFTTNGNPVYARKAFSLGASGYVLKAAGIEDLPEALRAVLAGGVTYTSPGIAAGG